MSLNKQRARDLEGVVRQRLEEAAKASGGAIEYVGPIMDGIGRTAYDLYWRRPQPERGLRVSVDGLNGVIAWTWIRQGEGGRKRIDPLQFDVAFLDKLIFALAEQGAWEGGSTPSIR